MTDTTDLLASTGLNDPNSPWNLNGLLQTGINIGNEQLQAALGTQTSETASTSGNGTPAAGPSLAPVPIRKQNWLMIAIAGLAVLAVGWLLLRD